MSSIPAATRPLTAIRPETPGDFASIEALHEKAFGPGRFAKGAYRVRERADPVPELAFVATDAGTLIGSVRFSRVTIGGESALFLGPLAIDPAFAGQGLGVALMVQSLALAEGLSATCCVLVGDLAYYARVGFKPVPPGRVVFPAPVDPARLLWHPLNRLEDTAPPVGNLEGARVA